MSSWSKSSPASRRALANPNGSAAQLRLFRRAAPYPTREEKAVELTDALGSYEEFDQIQNYSGNVTFEGFKAAAKPEGCTPSDRRKSLYQKFYRMVQEERKPADCVVISITSACLDYPKSLSQSLQERGLSVDMLYLQAESGLTRALQDVRADGSPFCILVEQTNIALSSCTVIIFSESLKIHRNMPKEQAMDFVAAEHGRGPAKERPARDPADIAAQASQLLDDFLDREKIERHSVPPETRPLLLLLAEGVHLYLEELDTIAHYVRTRQELVQAFKAEGDRGNILPPGLRKPPPLLPTPPRPPPPQPKSDVDAAAMDVPSGSRAPLLPSPGSHPKSKPPPLLSLPGPSLGGPPLRGPLSFGGPRGPLLHPSPSYHPGPRGHHGARGAPPSLKSSRPPLLPAPPGPLLARLGVPRH